ncbi:hypothetical protein OPV22_020234 [Ensete ventricosum]|uniref:Uncharacterized protein n=1 Tax=Ensete ventricosum TaxID=4639 RepID=A0AAV8QKX1_ENSVE|nr:hypothetical protein OPV22_020234 [Ensete ventricosum]
MAPLNFEFLTILTLLSLAPDHHINKRRWLFGVVSISASTSRLPANVSSWRHRPGSRFSVGHRLLCFDSDHPDVVHMRRIRQPMASGSHLLGDVQESLLNDQPLVLYFPGIGFCTTDCGIRQLLILSDQLLERILAVRLISVMITLLKLILAHVFAPGLGALRSIQRAKQQQSDFGIQRIIIANPVTPQLGQTSFLLVGGELHDNVDITFKHSVAFFR